MLIPPKPSIRRTPPTRLPRRKSVTIALGVIGPFGIVIAADSEEGTLNAGDLKSTANKISGHSILKPQGIKPLLRKSIVISGAGDSGYLAAIKQHIIDDFSKDEVKDIDSADEAIKNRIETFY